jgi:Na+-driven multidrug efflux pump
MQRNEYVLKNMFGSFFLATVMTALMAQLGSIADSIVIGHLVSPDALSVVRIWQPVEPCVQSSSVLCHRLGLTCHSTIIALCR